MPEKGTSVAHSQQRCLEESCWARLLWCYVCMASMKARLSHRQVAT